MRSGGPDGRLDNVAPLAAGGTVLMPPMDYEGGAMPLQLPTNQRMQVMPRPLFRDLRDPYVFREDGKICLLYSVAGERGIAGAILRD